MPDVLNVAEPPVVSRAPSADVAVASTRTPKPVPFASGLAGVKTRTVSSSAHVTLPATFLPLTTIENARAVVLLFIAFVKRTDTTAVGSTSVAPRAGRKRTSFGAATVSRRVSFGSATATPLVSLMALWKVMV